MSYYLMRTFLGYLLQIIPYAMISLSPFTDSFRHRKNTVMMFFSFLVLAFAALFSFLSISFTKYLPDMDYALTNTLFFVTVIIYFIFFMYEVRAIWQIKMLVFFFAIAIAQFVTEMLNLAMLLSPQLFPLDNYLYNGIYNPLQLLLSFLVIPWTLYFLRNILLPIKKMMDSKMWSTICIFCIAFYLLYSVTFILTPDFDEITLYSIYLRFLFNILHLSSYFVLFLAIHKILVNQREKQTLEQMIALSSQQYQQIVANMEHTRNLRHDMHHILRMVYAMICDGKDKEAAELIQSYTDRIQVSPMKNFSNSYTINTILNYYYDMASTHEISCDFSVKNIPATIPMEESDVCIILGNLLENAVTACLSLPAKSRFIRLHMKRQGSLLILTIDNSYGKAPVMTNGTYLSTKNISSGYGISSVRKLAEKYHGTAKFSHENGVFSVSILLADAQQ